MLWRDIFKKKVSQEWSIHVVHIPYWWDIQDSSLAATIYEVCPDAMENCSYCIGDPIPESPPSKLFVPLSTG
jgi:hypothetical protein